MNNMFHGIYNDNRPENVKGIIILSAAFLFVGSQLLNLFIPNNELIIYARILDVSATAAALFIFAKDCWIGIMRAVPRPRDFLICGIWIKFLSAEILGIYALMFRLADNPAWFLNNELITPTICLSVIAVVLHLCTPGTVEGVVPRKNQYALAVGIGVGVLLCGVLLASKPNIAPFINDLRPWIGDWWRTSLSAIGTAHG